MAFWLASLACHLRYALIILCVCLVIILFSKWTGAAASAPSPSVVAVTTAASAPSPSVVAVTTATAAAAMPPDHGRAVRALVEQARALHDTTTSQLHALNTGGGPVPAPGSLVQLGMQVSYALCYVECAQMLMSTAGEDGGAVLRPLVHSLESLRDHIMEEAGGGGGGGNAS